MGGSAAAEKWLLNGWGVAGFALVVRLVYVVGYEQYPPFLGDDGGYDTVAFQLANGQGFVQPADGPGRIIGFVPLIAYGPVYPAFLALLYFIFGHVLTPVRIAQAILGAATVLLVVRIAVVAFGKWHAALAGTLVTWHPALIVHTGMLITETLFAFMLVLTVWAMLLAARSRMPSTWLGAGAALGLTALLREEALLLFPLFVWTVWWYRPKELTIRNVAVFVLAMTLTVGVWTARNYEVFHDFVLVSANGGKTLWISTMGWDEWNFEDPTYQSLVQGLSDLERDRVLRREGLKNILNDPPHYLRLCFERIGPLWLGSHTRYLMGVSDSFASYIAQGAIGPVAVKAAFLILNTVLLLVACFGVWLSLTQEPEARCMRVVCLLPVISIAIVHFFLFAESRYQVPLHKS